MDDEATQAIFEVLFDIRKNTEEILGLLGEDDDGEEEEEEES